ncbi:uncharacterized protein JCM6883_006608 [Sporobolomyces salmoneus]|uniref:uncharacterized protein n=1 Tax=Sporobolomyces salmoneus TaxID=183962 RepID=UPI00317FD65A
MAVSKSTTVPLLALTFVFAVVGLGLSAALLAKSTFNTHTSRAVIIQGVFAESWTVFFSLIFLITSFVLPRNSFFSAGVVGIMMFLSFLQLIVAAGSCTSLYKDEGALYNSGVHRAWLGIAFISAFMALFTTVAAFLNYIASKAVTAQPKKEEEVHF